ncbi:MAG: hypothetical protein ROO76_19745 [Terriglobia bacterium]|jgi:hypothetical protein|nr:hypothetical protein [Terriglobia bacterium]
MKKCVGKVFSVVCVVATFAILAMPAAAQTSQVKEKPPMYSYVANWVIPRAQWGDMAKNNAADLPILQKALASGTIVGFGDDETLIHTPDGSTHDSWWSAMSMAGVLNVLEQFYTTGAATNAVLASSTKHWDNLWVSRYYNWHSGSFKGGYTKVSFYKLKKDAPDNAVDTLSKNLIAPLLEKLLADGTIHEYEIDTQAIHTSSPDGFSIVYIAATAEGLDKVDAAIHAAVQAQALSGPAFGSMTEYSAHRDELLRTNATYK